MASLFRNSVTRNGKRKTFPTWYGSYVDEDGKWAKVKLFTDKTASQRRLQEIQAEADRRRAGVVTVAMDHAQIPVNTHRDDYIASLKAENLDAQHVRISEFLMKRLIDWAGWKRLADITLDSVERVIARLGREKKTVSYQNKHIMRAKAFTAWLVERGRLVADPLVNLKKMREDSAAKNRARRSLEPDEVAALLESAPVERGRIYKFALLTGLRRAELADLRWGDLHRRAVRPYIQLRAEQTKSGLAEQVPLHPELQTVLDELIEGMPAVQVFKRIPDVATLEKDLTAAKVPFVDAMGRRADFHALRHTYCTMVARAVPNMKKGQELMRHRDPRLTANVYAHIGLADTAPAIAEVQLPKPRPKEQQLRKTGTDDSPGDEPGDSFSNTFPTAQKNRIRRALGPIPCTPLGYSAAFFAQYRGFWFRASCEESCRVLTRQTLISSRIYRVILHFPTQKNSRLQETWLAWAGPRLGLAGGLADLRSVLAVTTAYHQCRT